MKKTLILTTTLALAACGTIFNGTTQKIAFNTSVPNTKIYIDGLETCTAPCSTEIDRTSDSIQIVAKHKGYEDKTIILRSTINRTSYWNLVGIYSWSTDALSGGVWEYRNDNIYIQMEPKGMSAAQQKLFEKETAAKRFALYNFDELKIETAAGRNGEYTQALSNLSGYEANRIASLIQKSDTELDLAAEFDFQ